MLNEISFLGPAFEHVHYAGKGSHAGPRGFQKVGAFILDLDCKQKDTHRGNRSGKRVTQAVGIRLSAAEEDSFRLRGVVADMSDDMRVMNRDL